MNNATSVHSSSTVVVGFSFPVVKGLIKMFILHIHFSERQTNQSNIQPGPLKEYSNPVRLRPSPILNPISILYQNATMLIKKSRSCKTGGSPSGPQNNIRLLAQDVVYIIIYISQFHELRKSSNFCKCTSVSMASYPTRLDYPGSWHTCMTG
jgi:hypothetical protein